MTILFVTTSMTEPDSIKHRFLERGDGQLADTCEFLNRVFPDAKHLTPEYLQWMYFDNPAGQALACNAYLDGKPISHFALQRFNCQHFGERVAGGLVLHAATDPAHQNKGLLTSTGRNTIQAAKDVGLEVLVTVTNQNSTPVFISRLGFSLVCPLQVKIGIGLTPASKMAPSHSPERHFSIERTPEEFNWRLSRPGNDYFSLDNGKDLVRIYTPTQSFPLAPALELFQLHPGQITVSLNRDNTFYPFTMWMGLSALKNWKGKSFLDFPDFLKPSPLNFLYQDLTDQNRLLRPEDIEFNPIDFDAF